MKTVCSISKTPPPRQCPPAQATGLQHEKMVLSLRDSQRVGAGSCSLGLVVRVCASYRRQSAGFSLPCLGETTGCGRDLSDACKPSLLTRATSRPSARDRPVRSLSHRCRPDSLRLAPPRLPVSASSAFSAAGRHSTERSEVCSRDLSVGPTGQNANDCRAVSGASFHAEALVQTKTARQVTRGRASGTPRAPRGGSARRRGRSPQATPSNTTCCRRTPSRSTAAPSRTASRRETRCTS